MGPTLNPKPMGPLEGALHRRLSFSRDTVGTATLAWGVVVAMFRAYLCRCGAMSKILPRQKQSGFEEDPKGPRMS